MMNLTKLQDMYENIDPVAQKAIFDLIELLYKREQVPNNQNIFDEEDFNKAILDNNFKKIQDVDDFDIDLDENIDPVIEKEEDITKEEKDDIDEFLNNDTKEAPKRRGRPKKDKTKNSQSNQLLDNDTSNFYINLNEAEQKERSLGYVNAILGTLDTEKAFKNKSKEERMSILNKILHVANVLKKMTDEERHSLYNKYDTKIVKNNKNIPESRLLQLVFGYNYVLNNS